MAENKKYSITENGKTYTIAEKLNGDKFWYFNNKLHREAGPAIELVGGGKAWYFNGEKIKCGSQKDFDKHIQLKKTAEEKKYYDVRIEAMLPATLTYRVLAKNPQEALLLIKNMTPTGVKHRLIGRKEIEAKVYMAGSTMIMFIKKLIGL